MIDIVYLACNGKFKFDQELLILFLIFNFVCLFRKTN